MAVNEEIYKNLYSIVEANMKEAGKNMEFSEALFLACSDASPGLFDADRVMAVDREEALECAFRLGLDRGPEPAAVEAWSKVAIADDEEYKRMLVNTVVDSQEFKLKKKKCVNSKRLQNGLKDENTVTGKLRDAIYGGIAGVISRVRGTS